MIIFVCLLYLVVIVFLLLQLFILALNIAAIVFSIRRHPATFLDFLNGWLRFWSDLWYNIFRKKK